jgi:trimethylamine--corrinoid protein Co-methyltransferase
MCRGIPVDDETLALQAIRDVGPSGNFLSHRHTKKHMRELWLPQLFDRRTYPQWEEKRDGAREWAAERAKAILRDHKPEPLEPKLQKELKRIIEGAGVE